MKKILIETTDLDLCLGVGNLVVLQSPTGIENYSGKANMPIMSYDKPLIPIQSNLKLPDILPEPCEKMSMSIFNGVQLRLIGYEAFDTSCGGVHCNKSGLYFQGQVLPFCGCYQFVSRIAMPGIAWKLGLTLKSEEEIIICNFSSMTFLFDYIFTGDLFSPGVRASYLNDYELYEKIGNTVSSVIERVNKSGGFTGVTWQKSGLIQDALTKNVSGKPNTHKSYVASGTVRHHMVSLTSTNPENLNPDEMKDLKISFE